MNERKQVKVYKTIQKAREAVRDIDVEGPLEDDNYKLVHGVGLVKTDKPCIDERFNVVKEDTVKIKRSVEVLQWVERSEDNGEQGTRYFYEK